MFFQVWSLGFAHEATYLRPRETGEKEWEKTSEKEEENRCAPPRWEHSQQTLGAHEGSGRKRHQEEHVRQRGQTLLDSASLKAFSSAISHALPSASLEVRHCQTPPVFFFVILFVYSKSTISMLNSTCIKPKRTCHSWRNITVLLDNHVHCTFWNFLFLFPRTHHNNQPAAMSYTANNQTRKTTLPIRSEEWPMEQAAKRNARPLK